MDGWQLSKENAHPRARALLRDDALWSTTNDVAPFGNDTGFDVLHEYRKWCLKHPESTPLAFLAWLLRAWKVADTGWEAETEAEVLEMIQTNRRELAVRDDTIIALALAELVLFGRVDETVRRWAQRAVVRELTAPVLNGRWGQNAGERRSVLENVRNALTAEAASET